MLKYFVKTKQVKEDFLKAGDTCNKEMVFRKRRPDIFFKNHRVIEFDK